MAYVIKIKCEKTLRRLTLQKTELGEEGLSFAKLEGQIRDLFQLPPPAGLVLTYTDTDNDVVTMATNQDVQDALVHQSLNPLRVFVTLVDRKSDQAVAVVTDTEIYLKKMLRNLAKPECVTKLLQSYELLLEGTASSPAQASALVEKLVSTIRAQVAAAVKHGIDGAALTKSFGLGPSILSGQSSAAETSSRSSDALNAAAAAGVPEAAKECASSIFSDTFNGAPACKAEASKGSADPENVVHHAVDSSGEKKAEEVTVRSEPTMSFVKLEVPIPDVEGEVEAVPLPEDTKLAGNGVQASGSAVERDLGEGFSMVDVAFSVSGDDVVTSTKNEAAMVGASGSGEADNNVEEGVESTAESSAAEKADGEPITYPVLDVTRDQGLIAYPVVEVAVADNANEPVPATESDLSTPNALLGKLDAMGFTDSKLNLELLEKNNLDLRKTLDDLCCVEEWDPILEELEEMGFYDADLNRRLMFKNNGSVKSVVKELVQMYKDLQVERKICGVDN